MTLFREGPLPRRRRQRFVFTRAAATVVEYEGTGGATGGGSAALEVTQIFNGTGGAVGAGGAVVQFVEGGYQPVGGGTGAGAGTFVFTAVYAGTGGATGGGAADVVFVSGATPPPPPSAPSDTGGGGRVKAGVYYRPGARRPGRRERQATPVRLDVQVVGAGGARGGGVAAVQWAPSFRSLPPVRPQAPDPWRVRAYVGVGGARGGGAADVETVDGIEVTEEALLLKLIGRLPEEPEEETLLWQLVSA